MRRPRSNRSVLIASLLAMAASSCGFAHDEPIVGPYRLVAVDIFEEMSVCETLGSSSVVSCVVPSSVFAVGWNADFIIAKQHPFDETAKRPDKLVTNYWIVRVNGRTAKGPLSATEFLAVREQLSLPHDLQFTKEFHSLAGDAVRPNLAVNRTPAGGAGHDERLVGAGYLTR